MDFQQQKRRELKNDVIEEYEHESGATFIRMNNSDENAVFAVGFRTAPTSDRGIPHIIEHSVLSGSRNHPVDELFAEAKKSSICHFINALTYNDRTLYPVASHNDEELHKLAEIYLDSVFNPLFLDDPGIFRKEGWRIEQTDDGPEFQGVVLNEMKNSAYKPRRLLDYRTGKGLTPNTTYAYSSGGIPTSIVELSYEEAIDFYKTHYGTRNCMVFLYGDVDNEQAIRQTISQRLNAAHDGDPIRIPGQNQPGSQDQTAEYAASPEQAQNKQCHFRRAGLEEGSPEYVRRGAGLILQKLLNKDDGPFESTLRDEGFSRRVHPRYRISQLQPILSFDARQAEEGQLNELQSALDRAVEVTLDSGWDDDAVQAHIQDFIREQRQNATSTTRGFTKAQNVARNWSFNFDIPENMDNERGFERIRDEYDDETFRSMLRTLTHTDRTVDVTLTPDEDRMETIERELQVKIDQVEPTQPAQDRPARDGSVRPPTTEALKANHPERLVEDVGTAPEAVYTNSPELTTVNYFYNLNDCSADQLQSLAALTDYYGVADTEQHTFHEYKQALREIGAAVDFALTGRTDREQNVHVYLRSTIQAVPGSERGALDLYAELENSLSFNDKPALQARIEKNFRAARQSALTNDQVDQELRRRISRHFEYGGYQHGTFAELFRNADLRTGLEEGTTISKLETAADLLDPQRIEYAGVAAPPDKRDTTLNTAFGRPMSQNEHPDPKSLDRPDHGHATIYNKQSVAHVGIGLHLETIGREYDGRMNVLKAALNDYLWEAIRVEQGNYSVYTRLSRDGSFGIVARQGTDPEANLEAIKQARSYLQGLDPSGKELRRLKASALNSFEPPRSAPDALRWAIAKHIDGRSEQDILNERADLLGTSASYFAEQADFIDELIEDGSIVKQGNPKLIADPVGDVRNVEDLT